MLLVMKEAVRRSHMPADAFRDMRTCAYSSGNSDASSSCLPWVSAQAREHSRAPCRMMRSQCTCHDESNHGTLMHLACIMAHHGAAVVPAPLPPQVCLLGASRLQSDRNSSRGTCAATLTLTCLMPCTVCRPRTAQHLTARHRAQAVSHTRRRRSCKDSGGVGGLAVCFSKVARLQVLWVKIFDVSVDAAAGRRVVSGWQAGDYQEVGRDPCWASSAGHCKHSLCCVVVQICVAT